MFYKRQHFYRSLADPYPGLIERIRKAVEESDRKRRSAGRAGALGLWEHSVLVADLAHDIAETEKEDRQCAALAGLFLEAGRPGNGKRRGKGVSPGEAASRMAREVLDEAGLPPAVTGHVIRAVQSFHLPGPRRNRLADIIHDAHALADSGCLGVARFFGGFAMKGRLMDEAVSASLSEEMTRAGLLPMSMRTAAGRRLAVKKSRDSLRFYKDFLAELESIHNVRFRVGSYEVKGLKKDGRPVAVTLVLPVACSSCGGRIEVEPVQSRRREPREFAASVKCPECRTGFDLALRLPEFG